MNKIEFGNCLEIMQRWIDEGVKVNTCVTSPPYYGLRDYGVDEQLGLEETPKQYVDNMVRVFRLVRELLTDDGTLWVNIGDSYSSGGRTSTTNQSLRGDTEYGVKRPPIIEGIKQKDLIGIPWMLAFALREDGWYLRQDIIWHKPNPMPESVRDRCTKAHEYIFLLSKSPKYYFDNEAIKEPCINSAEEQIAKRNKKQHRENASKEEAKYVQHNFSKVEKIYEKRNKRDVWSVNVKPYKGAHFATYPVDLIEPCIKAGCPDGGIVLDPFMGSGTTAQVAIANNKQYLGCELNTEYKYLQDQRIGMI
jgi:DNA modification methylase